MTYESNTFYFFHHLNARFSDNWQSGLSTPVPGAVLGARLFSPIPMLDSLFSCVSAECEEPLHSLPILEVGTHLWLGNKSLKIFPGEPCDTN